MVETLDLLTARRAVLSAAAGFPSRYEPSPSGAREFIRRVGYLQIDTISVVARSHDHVLWSRTGLAGSELLPRLEGGGTGEGRQIFEYWAHAAAFLPIEDFRFCLPRMERIKRDGHEWFRSEGEVVRAVLDRVRAEGPLSTRDFEDPREAVGTWWDWKPAKRALEYLFHAGELLVARRSGFSKVFDLAERVIPPGTDLRVPDQAAAASLFVDRAVDAYGIFTAEEVAYGRKDLVAGIGPEIDSRAASGRLVELRIQGTGDRPYYASPETLAATSLGEGGLQAHLLSPFDPFIIDRKRIARLFGFSYALECYLPPQKRRFGYFALPILLSGPGPQGEGFIGLVDAKADRRGRTLEVRRLALGEDAGCPWFRGRGSADAARAVGRTLGAFARFNGAERLSLGTVQAPSAAARDALLRAVEEVFA